MSALDIIILFIGFFLVYLGGYLEGCERGRRTALEKNSAAQTHGLMTEYGHGLKDGESL